MYIFTSFYAVAQTGVMNLNLNLAQMLGETGRMCIYIKYLDIRTYLLLYTKKINNKCPKTLKISFCTFGIVPKESFVIKMLSH